MPVLENGGIAKCRVWKVPISVAIPKITNEMFELLLFGACLTFRGRFVWDKTRLYHFRVIKSTQQEKVEREKKLFRNHKYC